ncbi:phosphoglucomutase [Xiashengella succiniciproducens]|jgi:phosphomannomutase|uniref:Phosphoglucomutase n=1 Tax=Xiashengella succiniciproducens TaxID=2949635 RepID=A0A9J6ZSD0_9BACT|nr:phosphoglucomutase [Alkaliflexus sp. Ai-910]URW80844.1 phosphoglucomutase [Alkaliflexus sp. Ai-910]
MSKIDWKELQNGSDIRGIALEGVPGEKVNLTPEAVSRIGQSFVGWLHKRYPGTRLSISVGMDSRLSGPVLKDALIKALIDCGVDVYDLGLASSPAMFMSTLSEDQPVTAAIMLTASHLPFNRNGMKFYTCEGGLDKADITDILELAASNASFRGKTKGSIEKRDFMAEYAARFVKIIREQVNHPKHFDEPLSGLKIVVDAGNGAGGFYATEVLARLGADISASQFLEPDGRFPNHVPNPEDEIAMLSVTRQVKATNADLGIIFDTDVDRAALVVRNGQMINRNSLIAMVSAVILREHPGTTIVTDSITSNGLTWFINEYLGGHHHRFQRGYKNVINEAIRLNKEGKECHLAIETSGHAALKENHFLDDGAYLITKLIITMARLQQEGKSLINLIEKLPTPASSIEIRIGINTPDFKEYGEKVITELGLYAANHVGWELATENYEGLRVQCSKPQGWFLLRLSLHDPVLPLNIESEETVGMKEIISELSRFFENYDDLDLSGLKNID